MDDQIGRLLQAVEDAVQSERAIVIFLSDNGPTEDRPACVNDQFLSMPKIHRIGLCVIPVVLLGTRPRCGKMAFAVHS